MRSHLILLCTYAVLTSCAPNPGGYSQHEYQFQRASSSYRNNELQHQNEEMGRYSRVEDPDKLPAPQERSQYRQSEYHAPGSENTNLDDSEASRNLGVKGFKPRAQMNHWNGGSQLYGGQTQDRIHGRYYQSNDFQTAYVPSSRHHTHGFHEENQELHGNHHRNHGLNGYSQTQTQSEYTGSTASSTTDQTKDETLTSLHQSNDFQTAYVPSSRHHTHGFHEENQELHGNHGLNGYSQTQTQSEYSGSSVSSATDTALNTDKAKDETLTNLHQSNDFQTGYIPGTRYQGYHPYRLHQENYEHHGHRDHANHHRHHGFNSFSQTQSGSTASSATAKDDTLASLDETPFDYSKFKEHGFGKEYLENTEGQTIMVSSSRPTSVVSLTPISYSSTPTTVVVENTKPLYENAGSGREYSRRTSAVSLTPITLLTSSSRPAMVATDNTKPLYENVGSGREYFRPTSGASLTPITLLSSSSGPTMVVTENTKPLHGNAGSGREYFRPTSGASLTPITLLSSSSGATMVVTENTKPLHGNAGSGREYFRPTSGASLTPITLLSSSSGPTMVVTENTKPLYENAGSGREYWEKTEGQTSYYASTNARPTTLHQSIKPVYEIPEPTISIPSSQNNKDENLQAAFDRIDQIRTMYDGRSLTANRGTGIGQETYQNKDNTQQTMDFSGADCDYGLNTQSQTGFNQFQTQSQMHGGVTHQFKENVATTPIYNAFDQQNEDLTQQTQTLGTLGFTDQKMMNHQNEFTGQTQEDQKQDNFGKFEFGSQHKEESTTNEMTQQTQNIFGKFEFANQGQEDLSQHTQTAFTDYDFTDQNEDMKQQKFYVQTHKEASNEDMVQQTQDGFGNFEFGSLNKEDMMQQKASEEELTQMTQQAQDAFGKFEFGSQHQEDMKKNNTHENNMRSDGKLEFNNQQEDLTQKTEQMTQQFDNFGAYNQKHEQNDDLTQQTQDAFTNFDQSHDSQQQHGYGQLEFASQHQGTEEQQNEYGQFEFGDQQQEDLTQKNENLGGFYIQSSTPQSNTGTYNNNGRSVPSSRSYSSQNQFQRSSSSSSSSSSAYSRSSSASSTGSGQINYGLVHRIPDEENVEDLHQNKEEQFATEIHDVSQHVQKVQDLNLEAQKEDLENFNHKTGQEILSQTHIEPEEEIAVVEEHTSEKPGFWKRLGGSITSTYENAKEKTKNLADKVKHNLG